MTALLATSLTIEAVAGETLDQLVFRVLGKGAGAVELVLAANPGLGDLGLFLPRGRRVVIPVSADVPSTTPTVQLWT